MCFYKYKDPFLLLFTLLSFLPYFCKTKLFLSTHWRFIRGEEVQLHSFLISTLDGSTWSTSRPGYFTPRQGNWYWV